MSTASIVSPKKRRPSVKVISGFPLFDGIHSPQNLCVISFGLGLLAGFGSLSGPLGKTIGLLATLSESVYLEKALLDKSNTLSDFLPPGLKQLSFIMCAGLCEYLLKYYLFGLGAVPYWTLFFYTYSVLTILSIVTTAIAPLVRFKSLDKWIATAKYLYPYWDNPCAMLMFYWLVLTQLMLFNVGTVIALFVFKERLQPDELHGQVHPRDPNYRPHLGVFGLPLLDGEHSEQNVSLYGFLLGTVSGIGLCVGSSQFSFNGFGFFLFFLGMFHLLEYLPTAMLAFLLNHSREYHLAMIAGFVEYMIEWILFPSLKRFGLLNWAALYVVLAAQMLRTGAMISAGVSFSHVIADQKEEDHVLVTSGIYSIFRHPSYTGFFYWSLGLQLMMGNPVCFLGFIRVLTQFFANRIEYEEETLVDFFGDAYKQYRQRSRVFIPGIH